ncbi:MAG: orotate phosphoribosyltransferase, partial [Methanomicrobiales archaeon]|nr:orotate phosphoribosyltransferase [Methanomicrobiales archaeon]
MVTERLQDLLESSGAVKYGDFLLASGERSRYYVDVKTAATDPALLWVIGAEIARIGDFQVVAGVAVGGIPIAVATSLAGGIPYAIVREKEKAHGREGLIIGEVAGKDVLLVEDVTTSGGSALFGIRALRAAEAKVTRVVTVVDREQGAEKVL